MAVALGYGVLCAAVVTLFLVPCGYVILDDVTGRRAGRPRPAPAELHVIGDEGWTTGRERGGATR
jgi:hypothetical protein